MGWDVKNKKIWEKKLRKSNFYFFYITLVELKWVLE